MTQKDFTHQTDLVSYAPTLATNRRLLLAVMGLALIVALAVTLTTLRPTANEAPTTSTITVIPYGNALEMQYAQPWLNASKHEVMAIPYGNALEMQYAQPWLEAQKSETATPTHYSDALSWFYARPWLTPQAPLNCHSRLDMLYACQYGHWQP